jgi:two-component system, chemotaxis family, CheB/CheR fusion protein
LGARLLDGEEAYSLAIVFREALAAVRPERAVTLQIFATDLNADAIAVARLGTYSANIEAAVSPERRQRFFARERGGYRIHKDIRSMVTFATHNLTSDPPFTRLDLISCRNLLIYLTPEVQKRLMAVFHYALRPGGVLVLGGAESTSDANGLFGVIDASSRVYRRLEGGRPQASRELALRLAPSDGSPDARSFSPPTRSFSPPTRN